MKEWRMPAEWEPQAFVQLTWPHAGTDWQPIEPENRGRHASFASALDTVAKTLAKEACGGFFDVLADEWHKMFPSLPAKPGRHDGNCLTLYVRSASVLFSVRPRLAMVKRAIATLPGAPENLKVVLEIHA